MRQRFVRPETTRLPITDGDWLLVKRRLTAGEQRAAYARMYVAGVDGKLTRNPLQAGLALVVAYLIDWSLVDEAGAVVPIRGLSHDDLTAVLDSLDILSFVEIRDAIEAHDALMAAEMTEEKKLPVGTTNSGVTSPSPSAAGGGLSGSVN